MILWVALFFLIIFISFVFASRSMRDFREAPQEGYSLYLIRKTNALDSKILDFLHSDLLRLKSNLSFERLIKGDKSALVVFLPKALAPKYKKELGLLELEDYANVNLNLSVTWDVNLKEQEKYFKNFPALTPGEQFWWQFVILPERERSFRLQIKAIFVGERINLAGILQKLETEFEMLDKTIDNRKMIEYYKNRKFSGNLTIPALSSSDILKLIRV